MRTLSGLAAVTLVAALSACSSGPPVVERVVTAPPATAVVVPQPVVMPQQVIVPAAPMVATVPVAPAQTVVMPPAVMPPTTVYPAPVPTYYSGNSPITENQDVRRDSENGGGM